MKPATLFLVFAWILMLGFVSGRPSIKDETDSDMAAVPNDYSEILAMRENLRLALDGLDGQMRTAEQFVYPASAGESTTARSDDHSSLDGPIQQFETEGKVTVDFHEVVSKTVDSIAGKIAGNPWIAYGLIGLGLVSVITIVSLVICCCFKR